MVERGIAGGPAPVLGQADARPECSGARNAVDLRISGLAAVVVNGERVWHQVGNAGCRELVRSSPEHWARAIRLGRRARRSQARLRARDEGSITVSADRERGVAIPHLGPGAIRWIFAQRRRLRAGTHAGVRLVASRAAVFGKADALTDIPRTGSRRSEVSCPASRGQGIRHQVGCARGVHVLGFTVGARRDRRRRGASMAKVATAGAARAATENPAARMSRDAEIHCVTISASL